MRVIGTVYIFKVFFRQDYEFVSVLWCSFQLLNPHVYHRFSHYHFSFDYEPLQGDFLHESTRMTVEADGSIFLPKL